MRFCNVGPASHYPVSPSTTSGFIVALLLAVVLNCPFGRRRRRRATHALFIQLCCLYIHQSRYRITIWKSTMNSAPSNASSSGGKSLNISSSHAPLQQQQNQTTSPSFDSGSRRSASHSNPVNASPRNNQGHKKQHKNSRRPRLADEDAMAESV